MHLLGFRFAPRMRDFADRRLYVLGPAASYRRLTALIADSIRADLIEESWDELLRLATSIKVGAITPSVMRTRLAAYPRQGSLAEALRELGRIERTLFALDWLDHPALHRPSLVALTGREAHPSFKRTVFFNRLGERCDRTFGNQGYHASGLDLVIATIVLWNAVYPPHGPSTRSASGWDRACRFPRSCRAARLGACRPHRRLQLDRYRSWPGPLSTAPRPTILALQARCITDNLERNLR